MDTVAVTEFPFVEELPARKKGKLRTLWERLAEWQSIASEKGTLIPFRAAAALLDVSHQRIDQIVEDGRLERFDYDGHRYVTEVSLVALARQERNCGTRLWKSLEQATSIRGALARARKNTSK